jgi:hypothetical protein
MTGARTDAELVASDVVVDWESPAGPEDVAGHARSDFPALVYIGPGEAHWIGQRCEILATLPGHTGAPLVRLACGCRARVPYTALQVG